MDTSTTTPTRKPHPAARALHRQMMAVQRTMSAPTVEESENASRWAQAWYMLVQRKLEEIQHAPRYLH
jgi:hypothetical protein